MEKRICKQCNEEKEITLFSFTTKNRKRIYRNFCKKCWTLRRSQYTKKYYSDNKGKILNYHKKYDLENKGKIKNYKKEYYKNNKEKCRENKIKNYLKNKNKYIEYNKRYSIENKDKISAYMKNKYKNDVMYRLMHYQRTRIDKIFKSINKIKSNHTIKLIGCTKQQLKEHIEKQFKPGMSWDNFGTEWQLDHALPIAYFKSIGEIEKAFHYTNLQPLWKYENQFKSDKIVTFPDGTIKPLSDYF